MPLMQKTLKFWVPMNLVQFLWIPTQWQVPFVCVAGLAWTVILSLVAGKCTKEYCMIVDVVDDPLDLNDMGSQPKAFETFKVA